MLSTNTKAPASCDQARADAAMLRALQDGDTLDKLGRLSERIKAVEALGASGKRCSHDLSQR
jgi:hypothetical protein